MKSLLVLASLFLPLMSWAESPAARFCRINGGQHWVVNFSASEDVMLCRFGSAAIGAQDYFEYKDSGVYKQSLYAYASQVDSQGTDGICEKFHSTLRFAKDSDGRNWRLCVFGDGSVMEARTLARGVSAAENEGLNSAL